MLMQDIIETRGASENEITINPSSPTKWLDIFVINPSEWGKNIGLQLPESEWRNSSKILRVTERPGLAILTAEHRGDQSQHIEKVWLVVSRPIESNLSNTEHWIIKSGSLELHFMDGNKYATSFISGDLVDVSVMTSGKWITCPLSDLPANLYSFTKAPNWKNTISNLLNHHTTNHKP